MGKTLQLSFGSRRRLLVAAALWPVARVARGQASVAPMRIVTGFPPGGGSDAVARLLSDRLHDLLGATVLVENRAGAGARIAIEHVRTAPADGSVMLLVPDAVMFLYPHVYKSLGYDPERDFAPVARLVSLSLAMFVGPMVPAQVRSVADYVAWARADASRLVYGTTAAGATPHFVGAMFARRAGLPMTPAHYRGGAPGIQDLAGGHVPVLFGSITDGLAQLQLGRIRALATAGLHRAAGLADVPTFAEQGYADLVVEDGLGIHVPIGVPAEHVANLSEALLEAMRARNVPDALRGWGYEGAAEGAAEFAARLRRERLRWGPIIRASEFAAID